MHYDRNSAARVKSLAMIIACMAACVIGMGRVSFLRLQRTAKNVKPRKPPKNRKEYFWVKRKKINCKKYLAIVKNVKGFWGFHFYTKRPFLGAISFLISLFYRIFFGPPLISISEWNHDFEGPAVQQKHDHDPSLL